MKDVEFILAEIKYHAIELATKADTLKFYAENFQTSWRKNKRFSELRREWKELQRLMNELNQCKPRERVIGDKPYRGYTV
jgi:hypothetical protein